MRGRGRTRGKPQGPSFWKKNQKWLKIGGMAAGGVIVLLIVVTIILSMSTPSVDQPDQIRERLTTGGYGQELRESNAGLAGTVWVPAKTEGKGSDPMVIYHEVSITVSGGKCKSATAETFASAEGRRSPKKQPLCSLTFAAGSGVTVKETKSGAQQTLVDRAKREFEQITTAISK